MALAHGAWYQSTAALSIRYSDDVSLPPFLSASALWSRRPEIFRMTELNDNSELQAYSSAVLYVLSAVTPPAEFIEVILDNFVTAIKNSTVRQYVI